MRESFVSTLLTFARKDPNIVLITGDLGYGVLDQFAEELPNQFVNAGVAEQAMMGMAAGLASTNKSVFVYSIANFPTMRCLEQIRNDVCGMNRNVKIVSVGAGYSYGPQGYSHHAIEDISVMRALPNMQIFSPADPVETEACTRFVIDSFGPSYLRLGKSNEKNLDSVESLIGVEPRLVKPGNFGTILFTGSIGQNAITAWENLKKGNEFPQLISIPSFDRVTDEFLNKLVNFGPIITLEENIFAGGFGSYILELLSIFGLISKTKIVNLTAHRIKISTVGSQDYLRDENGLGVERIMHVFHSLVDMK